MNEYLSELMDNIYTIDSKVAVNDLVNSIMYKRVHYLSRLFDIFCTNTDFQ